MSTTTDGPRRALASLALPLGAAGALGLAAVLGGVARELAIALSPATPVDGFVVLAVTALGALLASWFGLHLLLGALCALGAATGRRWRAGERLLAEHGPAIVRRGVALALGTSLGLGGLAAATASTPVPDLGWVPTTGLERELEVPEPAELEQTGLDLESSAEIGDEEPEAEEADDEAHEPEDPDAEEDARPTEPRGTEEGAEAARERDTSSSQDLRTLTVSSGDSLWSLTASVLELDEVEHVAAAWPLLYEANRDLVGADPDLIHPGQELVVPVALEELS